MAEPQDWRTRVIGALGAVLAVALVVGGVVGAVAYGAARVTGLTGDDPAAQDTRAAQPASTTTSAAPSPAPSHHRSPVASPSHHSRSATPSHSPSPSEKPHHRKHHERAHHHKHARSGTLTLSASPHHVGHMGRIDLTGHYRGHGGATLVVQRFEGGHWSRFPVTARVRGGDFHTWVESGRQGPNRFRVVDESTGATSGPVTVTVG